MGYTPLVVRDGHGRSQRGGAVGGEGTQGRDSVGSVAKHELATE